MCVCVCVRVCVCACVHVDFVFRVTHVDLPCSEIVRWGSSNTERLAKVNFYIFFA